MSGLFQLLGGVFAFLVVVGLLSSNAMRFSVDGNKAGRQIQNGIDGLSEDPQGQRPTVVIEAPEVTGR
ncbi:MAG: hypothetical protein AAGA75_17520 [Cyanobacteria bacterium P01_E01_bin.6]